MPQTKQRVLLEKFHHDVHRFNAQRMLWIVFSAVTIGFLFMIGITWDELQSLKSDAVLWSVGIFAGLITTVWWLWTMLLIRKIIDYQYKFISILGDITNDLQHIRTDLKDFNTDQVDNR